MLNELYLVPNETRTVMGGRHNFISGCFFGCNLRILDMFGVEIDRFNNIGNGFRFGNPENIQCRLEITNLNVEQDICVYSGDMEINNNKGYNNFARNAVYKGAVVGEYGVNGLRNLTQKTCELFISSRYSFYFNYTISNVASFCTETAHPIYTSNGTDASALFDNYSGSVGSISTAVSKVFIDDKLYSSFLNKETHTLLLPPNRQFILVCLNVNTAYGLNIKISYRG